METALQQILDLHQQELQREKSELTQRLEHNITSENIRLKKHLDELTQEFENSKSEWQAEREALLSKIENLESYSDVSMVKALAKRLDEEPERMNY